MSVPAHLLGRPITEFEYTNWRGETEVRRVVPDRIIWLDEPGYGYKAGWFFVGWDLKKNAFRQFSFDPERMRPHDEDGRTPLSTYGVNILLQVWR